MRGTLFTGISTLLFFLLVGYNGCSPRHIFDPQPSAEETSVGNPMAPTANKLLYAICGTINRCHPEVNFDRCQAGILTAEGLSVPLNLPASYSTLSSIIQGEQSGVLTGSVTEANSCYSTVNALECTDARVTNAYDETAANPFSAIPKMIPSESCGQVFTEPSQKLCPMSAHPNYIVDDLGDDTDGIPGDHICATTNGGCTLRAALVEANADGAGTFDLVIPSGTIQVNSPLPIASNVNIYGTCAGTTTLDGQLSSGVFGVQSENLKISMYSLKIQNGSGSSGGGIDGGFNNNVAFYGRFLNFNNNKSSGSNGGGAVFWWGTASTFNCTDCIFDSNQVTGVNARGGAVAIGNLSNKFERCLFVNNSVGTNGWGAVSDSSGGSTYINNTFYMNSGGAVYLNSPNSTFAFVNNTFVNNTATSGAGGIDTSSSPMTVHMTNNLLYNNSGTRGNCNIATITSHGGNLAYPVSNFCNLSHASDTSATPVLGAFQNNGGFSSTLALLPGSAGIDQGVLTSCPSEDQRRYSRPARGTCDSGSFEAQ